MVMGQGQLSCKEVLCEMGLISLGTGYKGNFFPLEDSEVLGQVVQDSCALSILEGFQDLPGTSWSVPALTRDLQKFLHT